jgi:L-alanine-DL-glutamate epimerase-like enolase superfamily enzyme
VRRLTVRHESFPIAGSFTISRGTKTAADVVLVELHDEQHCGRGECVPYARYGESIDGVIAAIESIRSELERGLSRADLQNTLPAGAARNAVDCALWDLDAKNAGKRVWELAGIDTPCTEVTAYTLSLDSPDAMQRAAQQHADRPLLKLKLAGDGDIERVSAVRQGAPEAKIIVDANEGWSIEQYHQMAPQLAELGVALIEQPLHADTDAALVGVERPVPLCADESCHDSATLAQLQGKYDVVNIKLDKTGGLTEALALRTAAESMGFEIMVGCMLASSLAMAPATLVASGVGTVDLDGPLLLADDRDHALDYSNNCVGLPAAALWG